MPPTTRKRSNNIASSVAVASEATTVAPPIKKTKKEETPKAKPKATEKQPKQTEKQPEPSEKQPKTLGKRLNEGDILPSDFPILINQKEEPVDLATLCKTKNIVIFFYPKANTPGCTKQACGFRDNFDSLMSATKGLEVFGCSADGPTSLSNWKEKFNLPFDFISDKSFEIIKPLGVFKAPKNISRSHVIIAKGGKLVRVQIGVSPGESVDDVVDFIVKQKKL